MNDEDILKAIDAGIADADPAAPVDEPAEETQDDEVDTPVEGGETTDEETPDEETSDEETSDEETPDEETPDEETPDEDDKPDEGEKPEPDPVNDPIDPRIKESTRKRIDALIERTKTASAERDQVRAAYQEHIQYVEATGATPQQYQQALGYLQMVNSRDPAKMEQALTIMQNEVAALARMLGKPVAGVDMVSGYPDLAHQVQTGAMTQQVANELAAAREQQRISREQAAAQAQYGTQQAQMQAAHQAGVQALNEIGAQLKATDPHYEAKARVLIPTLKPIMDQIPPDQWGAAFKRAYDQLPAPAVAAPAPVRKPAPTAQPMRAKSPAGGAAPAPKDLQDVIMNIDFTKVR